ncbi:MAG: DUF6434 domain-containing protein [Bacteroidota bacterium]
MQSNRPHFTEIKSGNEFSNWYWLKAEMVAICKTLSLPYSGGKFELRDRIIYALDHDGKILKPPKKKKATAKFNWAKEQLALSTVITDNVSFGPNFRRFMKRHIGKNFSCHSDFMDWARNNAGKTLQDAILKWQELEDRKKDPNFKRKIAAHNMMSQYVRDCFADHPELTFQEVHQCWERKKQLPMKEGRVKYEPSDLLFLE